MSGFDLQRHLSDAIRRIMVKAYSNARRNPLEAKALWRLQQTFLKSEKRRADITEKEGVDVPPFLICSIATACNLHCKGCYARANGIAADSDTEQKKSLSPDQWKSILEEAASLGVNFALLAGGEPMMRKDILERVAEVEDMIFPIFTNGTLIGPSYIAFLKRHLNMIPVISIEGTEHSTDTRRGEGMYKRAMLSIDMLHGEDLFFGTSITVTTENFEFVTSEAFVDSLRALGCKLIIYVEYVPTDPGTEYLALSEEDLKRMETVQEQQGNRHKDLIIISFPGDEKLMGGCLAAGRGFFHIGPDGSAEPCPFSPFSDSNVLESGLRGALASPLFRELRETRLVGGEHTGGCALYEHREEVKAILNRVQRQ